MKKICNVIASLLLASHAGAAELSFNNLELGYQSIEGDVDGFGIAGSVELNELFFLGASVGRFDTDFGNVNVYDAFVGVRSEFSDNAAVYGTIGLAKVSTEFGSSDAEAAASVGIRGMITPSFELDGSLNYVNVDGSDVGAELTGTFFFSDNVGASLSAFGEDGSSGAGVGLRVNF